MESYSSLAVAALESYQREQNLRREIEVLRLNPAITEAELAEVLQGDDFAELQAQARELRGDNSPRKGKRRVVTQVVPLDLFS